MQIKQLWRRFRNAGDRKDQVNSLMAIWIVTSRSFIEKSEELRTKAILFGRKLECWRYDLLVLFATQAASGVEPFVIAEDRQRAKKFFWAAGVWLIVETVLGTAIAYKRHWPGWSGAFIAISLAVGFDALFLLGWLRVQRPREAIDRLRRYFLYPSLILFAVALLIFFFGRTATGALVTSTISLTFLTLSLLIISICVLTFGATLLACAYILNWTYRDKSEYDVVARQQTSLRVMMDKTLRELSSRGVDTDPLLDQFAKLLRDRRLGPNSSRSAPSLGLFNSTAATAVKLLPVLLLIVSLSSSACDADRGSLASPDEPIATGTAYAQQMPSPPHSSSNVLPQSSATQDLVIGVDGTLSTHREAHKMLADNFINDASRIVVSQGVVSLRVLELVENGRVPKERAKIVFPQFVLPERARTDTGEAGILPNVEDEADREAGQQQEVSSRATLKAYVDGVKQALSRLGPEALLPSSQSSPKCTDLNGFLSFLITSAGEKPRLLIVFTDGEETCSDRLVPLAIPDNLTVLIMVLPLAPKETKDQEGLDVGFQERLDNIRKVFPSAHVVPYNVDIYESVVRAGRNSKIQNRP